MASKKAIENALNNDVMDGFESQGKKVAQKSRAIEKKPYSDYLRFDLCPKGGRDYKAYIMERAHLESAKSGVNVSATKYLHNLIDKDMDSQKGAKRTTKTDIIEMLDKLSEQELKAVQGIVKALCK